MEFTADSAGKFPFPIRKNRSTYWHISWVPWNQAGGLGTAAPRRSKAIGEKRGPQEIWHRDGPFPVHRSCTGGGRTVPNPAFYRESRQPGPGGGIPLPEPGESGPVPRERRVNRPKGGDRRRSGKRVARPPSRGRGEETQGANRCRGLPGTAQIPGDPGRPRGGFARERVRSRGEHPGRQEKRPGKPGEAGSHRQHREAWLRRRGTGPGNGRTRGKIWCEGRAGDP